MKKNIIRIAALIFALLFASLALASCGSKSADREDSGYNTVNSEAYGDYGFYSDGDYEYSADGDYSDSDSYGSEESKQAAPSQGNADSKSSSGGLAIEDAETRKIIRNAELDVETKNFDEFMSNIEKAVSQFKGYVESSNIYGNSYYETSFRSAYITARIPSANLDDFIGKIGDMGNITSKAMSSSDITAKYTDLEARIESYEAERTALLAILEKANDVSEIIQLRDKLADVNADLDSYKRQIKLYDSLVAYSTVKIDITEVSRLSPAKTDKGFFEELGDRLSDNLYDIAQGAREFALWFISSLPYLLIFAVIIIVIILIIRKIVKKKRAKKEAKNKAEEAS